ncbi:FecR family protein [Pontibacter oryzae]|uniref:DUF4974 domain-containing protein n=1 Tax=Pontibacter oryzae TaxID=2304593 RepID=A0A399SE87_9BACT|nr:FecR domain-containing protein [Pontibacter oryzae]RIJ42406.1 DUF4974 domain-containing protein [Pontibacter oryzae]
MEYQYYTSTDFATDEAFIQWVQHPTPARDAFWEKVWQEFPEQRSAIDEAKTLVLHLSFQSERIDAAELSEVWDNLGAARQNYLGNGGDNDEEDTVISMRFWQYRTYLVAAAVSALLLVGGYFLVRQYHKEPTVTYATNAGERMRLRLPDSSMVLLNGNSSITLPARWTPDTDRKVQLKGQAFFSVMHTRNSQRFVVLTPDGLAVEVLGTEFSVTSDTKTSQVILERGMVSLSHTKNASQQLTMAPGELVVLTEAYGFVKKEVDPNLYNAWKNTNLVFENTTLGEVAQMLEHSYGYQVSIADPALRGMRISASLNTNSPDHILTTVSETLEVAVQKQNNSIIISSN